MKQCNRILSLLLALVLVVGLIPTPALAVRELRDPCSVVQVNPHYADLFTEEDILARLPARTPGTLRPQATTTYPDLESAAQVLRDGMVNRDDEIEVSWHSTNDDYAADIYELMDLAMMHTGQPREGDCLQWVYGGWGITDLYYTYEDGGYNYYAVYSVFYYTTAEQEAELNTAVEELLEELDLEDESDYQKIARVYTYICDNITYDNEHLNDEDYYLMYTAYAALVNKTAVCQGYAVLLYRLLLELGVDCRVIAGWGGGPHGWNIVELDGLYYNVDATWDAGNYVFSWFMKSFWGFNLHERDMDYDTIAFHNEYPMSALDHRDYYIEGIDPYMDPYVYAAYANLEETAIWYLNRNGTVEFVGTGDCHDYPDSEWPLFGWWVDEITGVWVGEGITSLGTYSFYDFHALKKAEFPKTLTALDAGCFQDCVGLTEVWFTGDAPTIAADAFAGVTATVYYPGDNATWTDAVKQNYGGRLTWLPSGEDHDHDYQASVTAPTCTEQGYTTYTCSCGASYASDYVEALGHDFGPWESVGADLERRTCSRCGYAEERGLESGENDRNALFSDEEWEVLKLVNKERLAEGLKPLTGFALLQEVAGIRAVELEAYFSHTRPDGSDCFTAFEEVGLTDYLTVGENIAAGYFDAADVMTGWMNSPGHRENILRDGFDSVGIGYYYDPNSEYWFHWTQNFWGAQGRFTGYRVVLPEAGTSADFDDMDIYLVLEHSVDDFVHYLPLTEELVTITEANGVRTVRFDLLGLSGSFTIEAEPHTHSYQAVVTEPTCTEQGFTTYTCDCGESYVSDYTDALGHEMGAWQTVKEATCTEQGLEERKCVRCDHTETRATEIIPHSYQAVVTEPTCTEEGFTTYTCDCGESYVADYVEALGHEMGAWQTVKEATCTEQGLEERKCARCDHSETRATEIIPHSYQAVVTDPTCTEQGYTTYTCACGESYVADYTDALGHVWDEGVVTKEPTEEDYGERLHTCTVCGGTKTEKLPPLTHTHSYEASVTAPTCTGQGYTTHTCECGDSYVTDYVDALGHEMGDWATVTEATCTENGVEKRNCSRCDHAETREVAATGHSHEAVVTAPTCTKEGFTTYTCACGDSYVGDYVDALGHVYEDGSCVRCGEADPDFEEPVENPFTDVPEGSFFLEPVLWAVENGITNGLSATEFGPNATCNRAQVVTFLWRAAGCPEPTSTENPFVDVVAGSFYEKPVLWAVENGITNGSDATHFNPTGDCNRAQVVTFLYRAFGSPEVTTEGMPFTDVPADCWYEAPIAWAVKMGITNGLTATTFGPNSSCNRAQVVTFLYRAYN